MTDPSERSRVLTLVFTDLADSTALKSERGDVAVGQLIARHRELVVHLAEECAGRVIDWAGDGCFLTFETSSAGVVFALRLQQAHAEDSELPGVRIGLHMGEVTEKEGPSGTGGPPRIEGLAVDLAARIQSLARPGQVLMSLAVYQSARQRLGVDAFGAPILWQAYGDYSIKGFDDPLHICEAGLEGLSPLVAPEASEKAQPLAATGAPHGDTVVPDGPSPVWRSGIIALFFAAVIGVTLGTDMIARQFIGNRGDLAPVTSLAVLPLDSLSSDPDQGYFADGMTEAITAELAKIKSLKVISRTTAQRFRDSGLSSREIAAELNVQGFIEGSVMREGENVRIIILFIDARTDDHLLAETYNGTLTNGLQLQSEVALAIADSIRAELAPGERERIADAREVNPEAYDLYLRAVDAMTDITPTGMIQVRQLFARATELDPEFGEAWSGLAIANSMLGSYAVFPPRPFYEAAQETAERALILDSSLGEAQAVLGLTGLYLELDWESARSRFETAEALNPNSHFVAYMRAILELLEADLTGARAQANRVLELNPYSSFVISSAAMILMYSGQPDKALQILEGEVAKNPENFQAGILLTLSNLFLGNYESAIAEITRVQSITGPVSSVRAIRAYALALAGREEEARTAIESLETSVSPEVLAISPLPWALFALGDSDAAFEWLERGADAPTGFYLLGLRYTPVSEEWLRRKDLAAVAENPRYWQLIERLGYPPLPPEHPGYRLEQVWGAGRRAN